MTTDDWLLVVAAVLALMFVRRASRLGKELQEAWPAAQRWGDNFEVVFVGIYIAFLWVSGWYALKAFYPLLPIMGKSLKILLHL